jgi:hypothetical protein
MDPNELMDWFENGRAVPENSYTAYPDGRLILASTRKDWKTHKRAACRAALPSTTSWRT